MVEKALEFIISDFVQANKDSTDLTANEGFILALLDRASGELISLRNRLGAALRKGRLLDALQECGVDNWEGYSDAMELLPDWDKDDGIDD